MTTPHVTELPRRLEPVGRDTFLGVHTLDVSRHAARADNVVALRPRVVTQLRSTVPPPPAAA